MSVVSERDRIRIGAPGSVEDAETLLRLIRLEPGKSVDLTGAGHLHAAVVQVLLALRPDLIGPADDPFVRTWLAPFLVPDAHAKALS